MVTSSDHEFSPEPGPLPATEGLDYRNRGMQGGPMFQRIGWQRASAVERRLWLIQGAIIVGVVLLVGGLMLWILR